MTPEALQITIIILGVITIALSVWVFVLERRMKKLLAGKDALSLEETIVSLGKDIRALEKFQSDTENYITDSNKRIRRSVQGVETIRFNAFKGTGDGGNQSFAIALLSENGDGTVISSIFARDRMSIFAKPIKNFTSELEMTDEEKDAVKRATRS